MNTGRRRQINTMISQLKSQRKKLEQILAQEEEQLDDLPELLLESHRAGVMKIAILFMEDALNDQSKVITSLQLSIAPLRDES